MSCQTSIICDSLRSLTSLVFPKLQQSRALCSFSGLGYTIWGIGIKLYSINVLKTSLCTEIILRVEKVYSTNFSKSRISVLVHYKGTSEVFSSDQFANFGH